ncbi:MAG: hypothetical protein OXH07_07260 [Chloroflexi bacterium]|nr:hypothetical protein [Chloroflexota bacterium]
MFATRGQAHELPKDDGATRTITVDATDVYMSPSFIAELLVTLVEERDYEHVLVRGARQRPAEVAKHLAEKFGFADRVEVEQPALPTT